MNPCEFQVVKRHRKKTRRNFKGTSTGQCLEIDNEDTFDFAAFKKRLIGCMEELKLTKLVQDCVEKCSQTCDEQVAEQKSNRLYSNISECVLEKDVKHEQHLDKVSNPHLLSYGIGRFSTCPIARYQLALLLVLREKLKNPPCLVYDPVFSSGEKAVLEDLGCSVIPHNEEGKRICDSPTILFMPHCGKALYNNVIWANLSTLSNLVIIGNSFSRMLESTPHRLLMQTANYVIKTAPYIEETPLKSSSFVHSDVFNDLSLHIFPSSKLKTAPKEFWQGNTEPEYDKEEVEIIRKEDC